MKWKGGTTVMLIKSEIQKIPVIDNVALLARKLKQVTLDCPDQFRVQALRTHLKISARLGSLSHHSFLLPHNANPHQVTHIHGLNGVPSCIVNDEQSEKIMIKTPIKASVLKMPAVQMPVGDPLPIPVPKLSVGGKKEKKRTTSNKMDGLDYSSNGCTIGRPEGPGWDEILLEKSCYVSDLMTHDQAVSGHNVIKTPLY
ncbi:protein TBATA [Liasis olivaceus]